MTTAAGRPCLVIVVGLAVLGGLDDSRQCCLALAELKFFMDLLCDYKNYCSRRPAKSNSR